MHVAHSVIERFPPDGRPVTTETAVRQLDDVAPVATMDRDGASEDLGSPP